MRKASRKPQVAESGISEWGNLTLKVLLAIEYIDSQSKPIELKHLSTLRKRYSASSGERKRKRLFCYDKTRYKIKYSGSRQGKVVPQKVIVLYTKYVLLATKQVLVTEHGVPHTKPKYVQVIDSEKYREGKVKQKYGQYGEKIVKPDCQQEDIARNVVHYRTFCIMGQRLNV